MLDLFMLALMILCALLGPADAERFAIDLYDAKSGRVQTLDVQRSSGGFELSSGPSRVVIKALGEGKYSVQPGREEAQTFDLSAALAALANKAPVQTLELEGEKVRVSRSPGLTFVSPISREGAPLFLIRAQAGAEPSPLKIPPTRAGTTKDFLGWQEYDTPWELLKAQAQAGARGGHSSPAEVAIRFFASLMRGDDDYLEALSPNFKPELRAKLQAEIKAHTKDLVRFVSYAKIDIARALELKDLGRRPQALKEAFGDYEVLMFGEGNTSRTDIFLVFERVKGKWYLKGVAASFSEFLFKPGR